MISRGQTETVAAGRSPRPARYIAQRAAMLVSVAALALVAGVLRSAPAASGPVILLEYRAPGARNACLETWSAQRRFFCDRIFASKFQ